MTQYPQKLGIERFQATMNGLLKRVAKLETRTAGIDSGFPLMVLPGKVDAAYGGSGNPSVYVNGAAALSGPYAYAASYFPVAGDTVLLAPVGAQKTYVIICSTVAPAWQNMSLLNGWTVQSGAYARYMSLQDGSVWVQARLAAGTLTNGTAIWGAPAGYIPSNAHAQTAPVVCEGGSGTATAVPTPYVGINSSGNLVVEGLPSGLANCSVNFRYALT